MISRYGPCIGITLFRWFRWKVELWASPGNYETPEHTHPNSDSEFLVLYARHRCIYKRKNGALVEYRADFPSCLIHTLTVRSNEPHGFFSSVKPMVWLVLERWKKGSKVTSVSEDLKLT